MKLKGAKKTESDVGFITGVIDSKKIFTFERILWRFLRANIFMKHVELTEDFTDPITGETSKKCVFIIFAHGQIVLSKVRKICESFGATLYPCPQTSERRRELISQVEERMKDIQNVLSKTKEFRRRLLAEIARQIDEWELMAKREKAVYFAMNLFNLDYTSKCLIAEGWCPTNDLQNIQDALKRAQDTTQSQVPTVLTILPVKETPPTFNRTNKFTSGFQAIIDAYGVANYREINPTPFTCVTFPFLFAVMFGDIGHGILMSLFAGFIVWKEKSFAKHNYGEIFDTVYNGRYIILLMGLFSIYTGLIYNDIFSKGMALFGETGWVFHPGNLNGTYDGEFEKTYPFGLDPGWHNADNYLIFVNSYKMKMSVIFGVMQMTFGIVLSAFNHYHFKKYVSLINEFIPQMIFLQSIFGYLTFTIIYKWVNNWDGRVAPSLLDTLIYMFLSPGKIKDQLYEGQGTIQLILLVLALLSVPWMLLVKPFYLRYQHNKHQNYQQIANEPESEMESDVDFHDDGHSGENFDFGDIFVHQVIHTIEFCLGAISNTASYLRLWALSLAHAQLSDVLWTMSIGLMTGTEGFVPIIGMFGAFALWFTLTIAILLVMEGLSAFLHALRLHWVEFNNKFYAGNGYKFHPFAFSHLDDMNEEE